MILIASGEPVAKPHYANCIRVCLEFMHGDADAYTDTHYGPFDINTLLDSKGVHLEDLLRIIEAVKHTDPHDRDWERTVSKLPNWSLLSEDWAYEQGSDGDMRAQYDGHKLSLFDEHGREFHATYKLS